MNDDLRSWGNCDCYTTGDFFQLAGDFYCFDAIYDDFSIDANMHVPAQMPTKCNTDAYIGDNKENISPLPELPRLPIRGTPEKKDVPKPSRKGASRWSVQEDAVLKQLVSVGSTIDWVEVANELNRAFPQLPKRTSSQCSQHWKRVLDPTIVKGKWKKEEDCMLLDALKQNQFKKWSLLADLVPRRTDIQIRYRVQKNAEFFIRNGVDVSGLI